MKKIPKVFVKQNKKINNNKEIYYSAKDDGKDIFEQECYDENGFFWPYPNAQEEKANHEEGTIYVQFLCHRLQPGFLRRKQPDC